MINIDEIRMNFVYGDLLAHALQDRFDVIVHGCNCFHTMGKGIAKQIKIQFPEAYAADLRTEYGSSYKLGSISVANVNRVGTLRPRKLIHFRVVNAYTQFFVGKHANLDCIRTCFNQIFTVFGSVTRIGIPRIGCGIGGLRWEEVENEIHGAAFAYNEHHGQYPDLTLVLQGREPDELEVKSEPISSSINDSY